MDVKGRLGRVRTWLWLCVAGSVATVFHYTLENSKPPEWLASLIQWLFGISGDAFSALVAKTLPLWSALFLGLLMVLVFTAAIGALANSYQRVKKNLEQANFANGELVQSNDKLREVNGDLTTKLAKLNALIAGSQKDVERLKGELESAQKDIRRHKDNAKTVPFTLDGLIGVNAFTAPATPRLFPKTARLLTQREISHRLKSKVLKAVMVCTKSEDYVSFENISELVEVGENELRSLLRSIEDDGYIKVSTSSCRPYYQLTPKAKMHFKSIENNVASELDFS